MATVPGGGTGFTSWLVVLRVGFTVFKGACRTGGSSRTRALFHVLRRRSTRVFLYERFCRFLMSSVGLGVRPTKLFSNGGFSTSVIVDVNKSKAFLGTTDEINSGGVPVLKVGAKHLKFLTSVSPTRVRGAFGRVRAKRCDIRRHDMLRLVYSSGRLRYSPCTLGRVTVLGHSDSSVVDVQATVGKTFLAACRTSKLVVSAPANSATCSLDMKKPVVMPRSGAVTVAPMTPRDLGMHPVIVYSS